MTREETNVISRMDLPNDYLRGSNKFDVPYHRYRLLLVNGEYVSMDIGYEEDWGNVQDCVPGDCDDWEGSVGWGNDLDGHIKIQMVYDEELNSFLPVREWAEKCVWSFVNNYSA